MGLFPEAQAGTGNGSIPLSKLPGIHIIDMMIF
jgi:hypothetical protein